MDVTLENSNIKDQIRHLQQTYEASMDKLREKQRQLEAAQMENQLLKMRVRQSTFPSDLSVLSLLFSSSSPFPYPPSHQSFLQAWSKDEEEEVSVHSVPPRVGVVHKHSFRACLSNYMANYSGFKAFLESA